MSAEVAGTDRAEVAGTDRAVLGEGLTLHRVPAGGMAERAVEVLQAALEAGADPRELAVLARVNSALLPVQVALAEHGIGHTGPLDASALQRTGVRTALAYLRLGLDTDRIARADVLETLNRPARKVKSAVTPLLPRGSRWSIRQLEQVADLLDGTHQERFAGYLGDLRALEAAITDGADTARCLWVIRARIGLGEAMDALDASRTRPEGSSHGDDLDALEQLAALHPDPATFATWLADRLQAPGTVDGITLSTVHRVKGREWPTVVVFAASQGLFPHRLATEDTEEERRVFHVALTRCQQAVHVVADQARPSPFLDELAAPPPTPRRAHVSTTPDGATTATPREVPPPLSTDGTLHAAVGVRLELAGGLEGAIVRLGRHHVVIALEDEPGASVRLPHGATVWLDGRAHRLGPPPPPGADRPATGAGVPADDALFEALRAWRTEVARRNGVAPYLVFHDRHLQAIAGRKPTTMGELAGCPGIGPAKLERYGDDLLDLIAEHL
ncbi:MAG: HRDC domain-containing protein [Nitriliruptoraceae bacterium]